MWRCIMPGVFEGGPDVNQSENELQVHIKMSHIPMITMKSHRLAAWEHQADERWWKEVEAFARGEVKHPFLTFLGVCGSGKTHLSIGIGWDWLEQGKTVLYYHVAGFLMALRDSFRLGAVEDYSSRIAFAQNCSLLILDDLGTERQTEFATEQLDLIVDYRYINRKPLIVTSNLALDELPPRIADRLGEGLLIHLKEVKGESYRKKKGRTHG